MAARQGSADAKANAKAHANAKANANASAHAHANAAATEPVNFARRATAPELMDADDLPFERYAAVLNDLAQINAMTRAAAPTLRWLARTTRGMASFTLLDVGFGHGDMLRRIARWSHARGVRATLMGVDLNPRSEVVARAATPASDGITYCTGDAAALDVRPDVIVSSLVAHHMTDDELVEFLRWMDRLATRGWFVNDLHRHRIAWLGFRLLAVVMRWHPIVQHDGALSVRRAFTRAEWEQLLARAGMARESVTIRRSFPFRLCVGCMK